MTQRIPPGVNIWHMLTGSVLLATAAMRVNVVA